MKKLLILSGKGGTGKTTIAAAFIRLAEAKAYADCDVDAPNLHLVMTQSGKPERADYYGLPKAQINPAHCIECGICSQNCRFDAIHSDETYKYVIDPYACEGCGVCEAVCPAGAVNMKPAVAGELMLYSVDSVFSTAQLKMGSGTSGMLVTEVKKRMNGAAFDASLAIIDGSPGIGCPVIASLSGVDMVLTVAEPSLSGISDMERIISTAGKFGIKVAVCINKYDANIENTEKIKQFCKSNDIFFSGTIPFDIEAVKAVNEGKSIVDVECVSGDAVKTIFRNTMEQLI